MIIENQINFITNTSTERVMNANIIGAITLAFEKHNHQFRKGTKFPYIIHPMNVMRLLLMEQAEDDDITDDVIIAGILHDVVEDTDLSLEAIGSKFGPEVQRLVQTASEPEELKKSKNQVGTWKDRKLHTINQLRHLDKAAKILSCCDKFDNAQSMNHDYGLVGDRLWGRFNASKENLFWYYQECLKAYAIGVSIEKSRIFRLLTKEVELLCTY